MRMVGHSIGAVLWPLGVGIVSAGLGDDISLTLTYTSLCVRFGFVCLWPCFPGLWTPLPLQASLRVPFACWATCKGMHADRDALWERWAGATRPVGGNVLGRVLRAILIRVVLRTLCLLCFSTMSGLFTAIVSSLD